MAVVLRGPCARQAKRCLWSMQGRAASSLASLVCSQAKENGSHLAVAAPKQGVRWSFKDVEDRAGRVAAGLAKHGVTRGSTVVTDLPNSADNLLLQVSCSWLGAADESQLAELQKVTDLRLAVTHKSGDSVNAALARYQLPASPVVVEDPCSSMQDLDGELGVLAAAAPAPMEGPRGDAALGFWSSTKALTNSEAIEEMGAAAKERLAMTNADRVLVSITLCHAFGIGSAVSSAWLAGPGLVLPGASGIRGCGSPSQRAEATLAAMISEKCSLLFADVHTLNALPAPEGDLVLRGGCCKVGSGADFLDIKEAKLGPNGEPQTQRWSDETLGVCCRAAGGCWKALNHGTSGCLSPSTFRPHRRSRRDLTHRSLLPQLNLVMRSLSFPCQAVLANLQSQRQLNSQVATVVRQDPEGKWVVRLEKDGKEVMLSGDKMEMAPSDAASTAPSSDGSEILSPEKWEILSPDRSNAASPVQQEPDQPKVESQQNHFEEWCSTHLQGVGEQKQLTLLLLGESGSGKSSFMNLLANFPTVMQHGQEAVAGKMSDFRNLEFENGLKDRKVSQTSAATVYQMDMGPLNLNIVDTPGVGDARDRSSDHAKLIVDCLKQLDHVNAIAFVISGRDSRLTAQLKDVMMEVCTIFPKAAKDNTSLHKHHGSLVLELRH
eukprot:s765_g18.t1